MRFILALAFLLFASCGFSQTKIDTIHCGNVIGYGKIVDGKKEGLWKYYDQLYKTPSFTGHYLKGQKTGEWIVYPHPYSSLKRVVHYKNNLLNGPVFIYTERNILHGKGEYCNGEKSGEWDYYFDDDHSIFKVEHYENGMPSGKWTTFPMKHYCWSGQMNQFGENGYWIGTDSIFVDDPINNPEVGGFEKVIVDTVFYVNGKEEGYSNAFYGRGNYIHGKKEGKWISENWNFYNITEYKNGVREGFDSLFINDTIALVTFFSNDEINGPQSFFNNGKITERGISIQNPQHYFYHSNFKRIEVPIDLEIDLIENGICDPNLTIISDFEPISTQIRDSLILLLKNAVFIPDSLPKPSPYSISETVRTGYWIYYWENGMIKEEGNHLPIVKDSVVWDSTHETEDPNNPGTFIIAPLETEFPLYLKTGWWKYYNEQGVMIREERFDEKGILVETKKY